MHSYDYILAGGGGAGLSLAYHLATSQLNDKRFLVVDEESKGANDRTWSFWVTGRTPFDDIAHKSWETLRVIGDGKDMVLPLSPYRYQMLRSEDFYRYVLETLESLPNVDIRTAHVDEIVDTDTGAEIRIGEEWYSGDWVFDSLWRYQDLVVDESRYRNLKQHFKGVEIRADRDVFDTDVARMFDFRTPQNGVMRFFYVLPWSAREALVEFTLFSYRTLPPEEYDQRIESYIHDVLGIETYEELDSEACVIPMTDMPFERRPGGHILRIGSRGGRIKASTGYAFVRMQWDSEAIVKSLLKNGHPFDLPRTPRRYHLFDSILLQVLYRRGELSEHVFTRLFERNPVQRIFRFLDEQDGVGENLKLMSTVPIPVFLNAGWNVLFSSP